jgi:hypothetical protein
VFTLCGRVANGITENEVTSILQSMAKDIKSTFGTVHSTSAGIRAIKWENSDPHIMCIVVTPKKDATPRAR